MDFRLRIRAAAASNPGVAEARTKTEQGMKSVRGTSDLAVGRAHIVLAALITVTALLSTVVGAQAQTSPLASLATSMAPGTFVVLPTNNITDTLKASGASGIVFGFTDKAVWDPATRQFF